MFIKTGLSTKKNHFQFLTNIIHEKFTIHIPGTFNVYYIEHEDKNRTMFVYSLKEIWILINSLIFLIK